MIAANSGEDWIRLFLFPGVPLAERYLCAVLVGLAVPVGAAAFGDDSRVVG
jgi:hypothetical protein